MTWTLFQGHNNSGRNKGGFRFYARSTMIVTIIPWKYLTKRSPFSALFHWKRTVTNYSNVMNGGQFWMGVSTVFLPCLLCKWLIPCSRWGKNKSQLTCCEQILKIPHPAVTKLTRSLLFGTLTLCLETWRRRSRCLLWIYSATVDCDEKMYSEWFGCVVKLHAIRQCSQQPLKPNVVFVTHWLISPVCTGDHKMK